MKKNIIIESTEVVEVKEEKRNTYKDNYHKLINNNVIEWLIYMIGYAIVLVIVSSLFESFEVNTKYFGIYALLSSIIINILNHTIKPIINFLTLPLTIVSLGILYPISNVIILYITSFILGKNIFYIGGFIAPLIIAVIISFLNILMEGLIIKPITKRNRQWIEFYLVLDQLIFTIIL